MWLFTRHGFYSVVSAKANGGKGPGLDANLMMVRGRRREELEALRENFAELKGVETVVDAGTDYRYRMFLPRAVWVKVAAELAEGIDYGNFKGEAARATGGDYAHALHDVWDVMYGHQEREPRA